MGQSKKKYKICEKSFKKREQILVEKEKQKKCVAWIVLYKCKAYFLGSLKYYSMLETIELVCIFRAFKGQISFAQNKFEQLTNYALYV